MPSKPQCLSVGELLRTGVCINVGVIDREGEAPPSLK